MAVVLVMAALMREISDQSYQRGKEILALLLGVFGTIVGAHTTYVVWAGVLCRQQPFD